MILESWLLSLIKHWHCVGGWPDLLTQSSSIRPPVNKTLNHQLSYICERMDASLPHNIHVLHKCDHSALKWLLFHTTCEQTDVMRQQHTYWPPPRFWISCVVAPKYLLISNYDDISLFIIYFLFLLCCGQHTSWSSTIKQNKEKLFSSIWWLTPDTITSADLPHED